MLLGTGTVASLGEPLLCATARDPQVAASTARRLRAHVSPVSRHTVRITLAERSDVAVRVPRDGSLLDSVRAVAPQALPENVRRGAVTDLKVQVEEEPLAIRIDAPDGRTLQQLRVNAETGALSRPDA